MPFPRAEATRNGIDEPPKQGMTLKIVEWRCTMAGTAVAVFDDHEQADRAAQGLVDAGVPYADISLVRKNAPGETGSASSADLDDDSHLTHGFREVAMHD